MKKYVLHPYGKVNLGYSKQNAYKGRSPSPERHSAFGTHSELPHKKTINELNEQLRIEEEKERKMKNSEISIKLTKSLNVQAPAAIVTPIEKNKDSNFAKVS